MARFLFVVIPEKGHINPYIGPARSLQYRGHSVAFYAAHDVSDYLKACGFEDFFSGDPSRRPPSDANRGRLFAEHVRDPAWLRNWIKSVLLDPVPAQVEILRGVIREWRPDVVAIDSMVYAGAIAATREGVPWASLSSSLNPVASRTIETELTRTIAWLSPDRERLFAEYDMRPEFRVCDVLSPFLTTVFATKEFVEPDEALPLTLYMVGPSIPPGRLDNGPRRPAVEGFPQAQFDEAVRRKQPIICASLGSQIYYQPRIWRTIFDAVRGEPVFLVASVGELLGTDELGDVPENVLAAREIPQLEILDHASLLISHGGANSVMEALAAGVPVLVSPLCNDQPAQAHYLEKAGVGRRLDLNEATVEECRETVRDLLRLHSESLRCSYREVARRTCRPRRQRKLNRRCRLTKGPCEEHWYCRIAFRNSCKVHPSAALHYLYEQARGADTSASFLEYVAASRLPVARSEDWPCSAYSTGMFDDVGYVLFDVWTHAGSPRFAASSASRIRVFRVRCQGLRPLEVWDTEVKGGLVWQRPDRLGEMLDHLHRGTARFRWSCTPAAVAEGFDGLFLAGGRVDRHLHAGLTAVSAPYRICGCGGRGWWSSTWRGGSRLLNRLDLVTATTLDLGQAVLKVQSRGDHTARWRAAIPRDRVALPCLAPGDVADDVDEARARLVQAAASLLSVRRAPRSKESSFIFALPCELDDDGVPGPCSYAGLEGYRDFVRDVLEAAGVKIATAYVMNDAELAALASPGRLGKRVLTVTMGYGIGACLRVGDFGYDSDWVQHARIDLRPIGE